VIFNGQNPAFPVDAIYQLNLLTLQATNLSAITQPNGALDVDPSWTSDGQIIFATTVGSSPGEGIEEMHADGTGRQVLINDGSFNTDPTLSPNDNEVAVSAYLGTNPAATGSVPTAADPDKTLLDPQDWIVQLHNESTGQTTALTAGDACLSLTVTCLPGQSSGWQPHWSPDGETVAWIGRLNAATSCVCASGADGSNPQVLIETSTEDITWFDWTAPGGTAPAGAVPSAAIGSEAVTSRLLVSGENLVDDQDEILDAPADLMGGSPVATGAATDPVDASWSSDSSTFVFVANAPYDPHHPHYGPPPPKGHRVHVDFSLRQLNPLLPGYAPDKTPATEQVFLHRADGTVVQLTTPWTEDWRDAIEPGDARANTDPVISPNGRYVVFVNHSGQTGESFLLRMDLRTGAVLNLTNGNAGAMEVNDALPKFSPNGKEIAFTWTHGIDTDVAVMNTANGRTVTSVTDDGYDMDPAWSPNGKSIVFSHYHGRLDPTAAELDALTDLPAKRWSLVEVNVATGHETVLTTPGSSPTWRPVFSPDGQAIDFISLKYQTKGVFQTSANGGKVEPVLVMPDFNVTGVDWK
jgi:Tol biopolymer transport system component